MTRMSVMPERTASSTTYWMAGLSTRGSISLGCALVAGRNRVPRPAAGMTALRTGEGIRSRSTRGSFLSAHEAAHIVAVAGYDQAADRGQGDQLPPGTAPHGGDEGHSDGHAQ